MKRFLSLLLCFIMVWSLFGCGETKSTDEENSTETTQSSLSNGNGDENNGDIANSSGNTENSTDNSSSNVGSGSDLTSPSTSGGTDTSDTPPSSTTPSNPDTPSSSVPGGTTDSSVPGGTTDSSVPGGTTDSSVPGSTTDSSVPGGTTDSSMPGGTTDSSVPGSTTDSSVPGGTTDSSVPGSTTDSSVSGGTTDSSVSGGTDTPGVQTYPDRTKYKPITLGSGDNMAITYINENLYHPLLTPYFNGYKAALTMTFDDGYDTNTGVIVSNEFEKYGYRGTMMLGVCFINNDTYIQEWNNVFARGFLDLGCHGYDHKDPTTLPQSEYQHEIKDAILFLREKFPTQRVLTFATPLARITDNYESYLKDLVIGNRLESGGTAVVPGKTYNPYRVQAIRVDKSANLTAIHNLVESSLKTGKWTVELFHCVLENASNSTDIQKGVFEYHCKYLYQKYRNDIWFASFEDVLIYKKQLEHTTVAYTACDRESMTFTVTPDGALDKSIYNIPMSLKVFVPSKLCDSAYAVINGEYQYLDVLIDQETGYKYVIIKNIPATEQTDVKMYIGGNNTMKNGCVRHSYVEYMVVEATHDSYGYTVNECTKCGTSYNSKFTPLAHNFTGTKTVVVEPTEKVKGLAKFKCTMCDEYEVREIEFSENEEKETISFNGQKLVSPSVTPYYNGYKGAISFTMDDGYNGPTATHIADVMEKYGMRCTAMITASFVKDKPDVINRWSNAFARGCL